MIQEKIMDMTTPLPARTFDFFEIFGIKNSCSTESSVARV